MRANEPERAQERSETIRSTEAGVLYFLLIFGLGFILGTFRVLVATPYVGELSSVLIEMPIILTAAWLICAWLAKRFVVPRSWQFRLAMGGTAFILLMMAELGLSLWLFDNSIKAHLAGYGSLSKALGFAGQVIFALFPLIQLRMGSK